MRPPEPPHVHLGGLSTVGSGGLKPHSKCRARAHALGSPAPLAARDRSSAAALKRAERAPCVGADAFGAVGCEGGAWRARPAGGCAGGSSVPPSALHWAAMIFKEEQFCTKRRLDEYAREAGGGSGGGGNGGGETDDDEGPVGAAAVEWRCPADGEASPCALSADALTPARARQALARANVTALVFWGDSLALAQFEAALAFFGSPLGAVKSAKDGARLTKFDAIAPPGTGLTLKWLPCHGQSRLAWPKQARAPTGRAPARGARRPPTVV